MQQLFGRRRAHEEQFTPLPSSRRNDERVGNMWTILLEKVAVEMLRWR